MKASFDHSIDVLVKAYLNDTLAHGACSACAVGNLVAAATGTAPQKGSYGTFFHGEIIRNEEEEKRAFEFENGRVPQWPMLVLFCSLSHPEDEPESKMEVDATGYTRQELRNIEKAFERAPHGGSNDQWMFNGLLAVVDVLAEIHGVDLSTKEAAVSQFKEVQLSKA